MSDYDANGLPLTEWTINHAELRCPDDCGLYFEFLGTLPELQKFIDEHDCEDAIREAQ